MKSVFVSHRPYVLVLVLLSVFAVTLLSDARAAADPAPETLEWDTASDTWVATDNLGRSLPGFAVCGPPRADRWMGIFYFLWLGAHAQGGPYDITQILRRDPDAMRKPDSPLWGPLHAPHHWGESIFGHYLSDDPYVLRKHAQMLADAGIDTVIFDVTNQVTYRANYLALLRVFQAVRRDGGRTPQVAFLCPFWDPARVVAELYRDLYAPGLYPELWFRWEGKPLILADPDRLGTASGNDRRDTPAPLERGHTLGQSFSAAEPFSAIGCALPTWRDTHGAVTLALYREGPRGELIASRRVENLEDNAWIWLVMVEPRPAGRYYLELSQPDGRVGWWSHGQDVFPGGQAFADRAPVAGDRTVRLRLVTEPEARLRDFFTFRRPQPDYFRGPTGPNMWSWLEVAPQHVFTNALGETEQMSVGIAQNAVDQRLATMSEPGARGRSYRLRGRVTDPEAVLWGYNVMEQWDQALRVDPKFIFLTGWNEWHAGRFNEFNGVRMPVMFVDQFDQEHSRDIEPMKGGHGDNYYYQMVDYVRRYKGVRRPPLAGPPHTIRLADGFAAWATVTPEFRDDFGDTAHRDHPGYNRHAQYVNRSGRNDFVALKVARDAEHLFFYARTREAMIPTPCPAGLRLLLDVDASRRTGWEGYDFRVRFADGASPQARLERSTAAGSWEEVGPVAWHLRGAEIHLSLSRASLGVGPDRGRLGVDFKWVDNVPLTAALIEYLDYGDVAPNGRFNYRYQEEFSLP